MLLADEPTADPLWLPRIQALAQKLPQALATSDIALFALFQAATRIGQGYGSAHALSCALLAELCARQFGWPDGERRALVQAALTMNVSITALQDELVFRERTPTLEQRLAIDAHAEQSVAMLHRAGVEDALWLDTVRLHHGPDDAQRRFGELQPHERLARLLQRIDLFLAKISPRATRKGLNVTAAARDACLGPDGRPEEVGATLLRVLGFYPPGTVVHLRSGEIGIVLERGARADQPLVACLADARRRPLTSPRICRTSSPDNTVRAAGLPGDLPAAALRQLAELQQRPDL